MPSARSAPPCADQRHHVRVIAGAVGQQDAATRENSANAQSAAQGNETLVSNIVSLRDAIGETNTASGLGARRPPTSSTTMAETLSREVEKFFHNNLRSWVGGDAEERLSGPSLVEEPSAIQAGRRTARKTLSVCEY